MGSNWPSITLIKNPEVFFLFKNMIDIRSKRVAPEDGVWIPNWVLKEYKLPIQEATVFSVIYAFSKDGESEFYGTLKYLSTLTGIPTRTLKDILKRLEFKEYILKKSTVKNNITKNNYVAFHFEDFNRYKQQTGVDSAPGGVDSAPVIYSYNINTLDKDKSLSEKSIFFHEVTLGLCSSDESSQPVKSEPSQNPQTPLLSIVPAANPNGETIIVDGKKIKIPAKGKEINLIKKQPGSEGQKRLYESTNRIGTEFLDAGKKLFQMEPCYLANQLSWVKTSIDAYLEHSGVRVDSRMSIVMMVCLYLEAKKSFGEKAITPNTITINIETLKNKMEREYAIKNPPPAMTFDGYKDLYSHKQQNVAWNI